MDYYTNVKLALSHGFEEIHDIKAYRGKYYIKDELIWIHDIEALKTRLNIDEDEDLRRLNYDVESYYKYIDHTNEMVDELLKLKILKIKAAIDSSDSVLSNQHILLSNDKNSAITKALLEEGFSEEVLAALAHEMSKK